MFRFYRKVTPFNVRLFCTNIEVECKFRYNQDTKLVIQKAGHKLSEKRFTDEYFDLIPQYALSTKDIWLRKRDSTWEIKIPAQNTGKRNGIDSYQELYGEDKIQNFLSSQKLDIKSDSPFPKNFGLSTFAVINTHRESYLVEKQFENITAKVQVDFDDVDGYLIGECELMLKSSNQIDLTNAKKILQEFCKDFSLQTHPPVPGKVLNYISNNSPEHYKMLEKAGLLAQKLSK